MRILLISHEFTISGASQMLFRIAGHLLSNGHVVDVTPLLPTPGPLAQMYAAAGATVVQQFKPSSYELCLANTIFAGPAVAKLGASMPIVWWIHECDNGLRVALSNTSVYEQAFRNASRLLFPARHLADTVYRSFVYKLPPEKILIIPNGIELPADIAPAARAAPCRIVCVASVYPLKRQGDLLEALDALDRPDIEAIFIGKLDSMSERGMAILAKDRQRPVQRFRLLGELAHRDAMGWLASADLFAHPSESEGHPVAPLEAGLLRKPVVLADLPVYEGIWRHGHNCLIHPVGDTALLATLLDGLCRNVELRSRLGDQAHATAKRYTIRKFLQAFDELVLAGHGIQG
jgi:glycosyltransferase involved in cell wall biosynthesis